MNDATPHRRRGRTVLLAWLALLALMLASLGSAYLPLGRWNVVVGLVIATGKSAIVVWWFMRLADAGALARIAAAAALFMLATQACLSGVDYATRFVEPAAMQQPQQLRPLRQGGAAR